MGKGTKNTEQKEGKGEQDNCKALNQCCQIVYNLLSNAIKNTVKGSVHVTLASQENSVVLSVSDTGTSPHFLLYPHLICLFLLLNTHNEFVGIGISQEEVPKVFDRFHRVENSAGRRNSCHEGSGIGLALTQELV